MGGGSARREGDKSAGTPVVCAVRACVCSVCMCVCIKFCTLGLGKSMHEGVHHTYNTALMQHFLTLILGTHTHTL